MRKLGVALFVAVFVNVIASVSTLAQQAASAKKDVPAQAAAGEKSGQAEQVLRKMTDYLGKLPAFSCKVESAMKITSKDENNQAVTKMTVRLERPNKLAMIIDDGVMGMTVVSNGKELTQYLPLTKLYAVKDVPATYAQMTDIGEPISLTMLGMAGAVIPTNPEEFYKNLTAGVTESKYVGQEKVGDVLCHHLHFVQEDFDWDIWIEVGKRPVVHKVQPDLSKQLAGEGQLDKIQLEYVVTISDWNVAPKFTEADFTFNPPADAEEADSVIPEEPPHQLLGQAAPPFTTTDLAGQPIDLKSKIGKHVILLDFWATWCGPCVAAMPIVEEVAGKFKDKGLVFYAVNAGEEPDAIKEFLEKSKLNVPVALDQQGEIGKSYGVRGIPQTLLIGKDGKVQVVHVGFGPDIAKMLTKEIEDLLAGKDLAGEVLGKAEAAKKKREARKAAKAAEAAATPADGKAEQK